MRLDFRGADKAGDDELAVIADDPRFAVFAAKENLVQDEWGVHLLCRGGAGAGFMYLRPFSYRVWRCRMRISDDGNIPSTKVCLLLWEQNGNWQRDHHEIDYNESGDRDVSHQTEHYGATDNSGRHPMHQTNYPVDQRVWHTYGVSVQETLISYLCDGKLRAAVPNESPGVLWVPHFRTQPNLDTEGETKMDIRWIEVP